MDSHKKINLEIKEIKVQEEFNAKQVWQEFHAQFPVTTFIPDISDKKFSAEEKKKYHERNKWYELRLKEIKVEKKEYTREEKLQVIADKQQIRKIQKFWRERRSQDDLLVPVNLIGYHSTDFIEMLHEQKVKKSIHKEKIAALYQAISAGDWQADIFNDPKLPHIALALFAANKITQQQTTTILERFQLYHDFADDKSKDTFFILDDKGKFTKEARKFLLSAINKNIYYPTLREASYLEEFRLLIQTLPRSEQVFHVTSGAKYKAKRVNRFAHAMVFIWEGILNIQIDDALYVSHLSVGARHALRIVYVGAKNAVKDVGTIGDKTIDDIEKGVRQRKRYTILFFTDTVAFTDIHGYKKKDEPKENDLTITEATDHDIMHANIMTMHGADILKGFVKLADVIRKTTGFKWSREIWTLFDCDYTYVSLIEKNKPNLDKFKKIKAHTLSTKRNSDIFFGSLSNINGSKSYFLTDPDDHITIISIIFLLDFLKDKQSWNDIKIDLPKTREPYLKPIDHVHYFYENLSKIYSKISSDSEKIKIYKFMLYINLTHTFYDDEIEGKFNMISEFISENSTLIEENIRFVKQRGTHEIYLSINNQIMNHNPEENTKFVEEILNSIRLNIKYRR